MCVANMPNPNVPKPQRGDMCIADMVKPTKAPAGRHVCRIELMPDKSRKPLWIMLYE